MMPFGEHGCRLDIKLASHIPLSVGNMRAMGRRRERYAMSRVPQLCASPQMIAARFLPLWASGQRRPRAHMRRALGPFACIVCLAAPVPTWAQSLAPARPEEVGLSAERLERIGQVLNRGIEQGKLP